MLYFGFGLHAQWKDHQGNQWLEFYNPFDSRDIVLSAVNITPKINQKSTNKNPMRVMKNLGSFVYVDKFNSRW